MRWIGIRGGQLFLALFQDDWGEFIRTRCSMWLDVVDSIHNVLSSESDVVIRMGMEDLWDIEVRSRGDICN